MNEERSLDPFSTYLENKQLLNSIFLKEKMSKYSKQVIDKYVKSLLRAHKKVELTRELLDYGMIQDIVADYLMDMQWHVKYDAVYSDFDSRYSFDLLARKEKRTILVQVQPEITRKSLGEIQKDIFSITKDIGGARLLLATDILLLPSIFNKSVISDTIMDMAKKHGLGIIFVDKNQEYQETWAFPAEFLHVQLPMK